MSSVYTTTLFANPKIPIIQPFSDYFLFQKTKFFKQKKLFRLKKF